METIVKTTLLLLASLAVSSAMPTGKFAMPASCDESDYCTKKHELYPQELVDRLLKTSNITFTDGKPSLVDRIDEGDVERDCDVDSTDEPIYEIVDAEGNVRVVLQTDSDFRQIVDIERCQKPGHIDYETMHFKLPTVQKFNLHCVERKLELSFIVLTIDWQGVEIVKPKTGIPVGCDCKFFGKNTLL